jgi:hypothetical protein
MEKLYQELERRATLSHQELDISSLVATINNITDINHYKIMYMIILKWHDGEYSPKLVPHNSPVIDLSSLDDKLLRILEEYVRYFN